MSEHFSIRFAQSTFHVFVSWSLAIISEFSVKVDNHGQLHDCLVSLQSIGNEALSFEVAVLFAKWGVIEERSLVILHKALHGSSPAAQSLVSYMHVHMPTCGALFNARHFYDVYFTSGFDMFGKLLQLLW